MYYITYITLYSLDVPLNVWSFQCEIDKLNRIISDKTKQLLRILKWQSLVVSGQNVDKMDTVFQRWGIFYKFECSCKDCVEAFNFCVQIKEDVKYVKKLKEIIRYFFLFFFLSLFI